MITNIDEARAYYAEEKKIFLPKGKSFNVYGEILKAINHIGVLMKVYNVRLGIDSGKPRCNPAARFLKDVCDISVAQKIDACWNTKISNEEFIKAYEEAYVETISYAQLNKERLVNIPTIEFEKYYNLREDFYELPRRLTPDEIAEFECPIERGLL